MNCIHCKETISVPFL